MTPFRIIYAGVFLFAAMASSVSAQTFGWAKKGGGAGIEYGKSIAVDNAGNCYVTGFFSDTAWFGNQMIISAGGEDIFIAKYKRDGSLAWLKRGGHQQHDNGTAITVDNNNNVYVTGIYDIFCVLDSLVVFGGTMFTAKLDTTGNVLWLKSAQADRPWGISADSSGNSYLTGDYYTRAYFDNDTLLGIGKADIFCVKYSPAGDVVWAVRAGGKELDYGYSITTDPSGNSYVTGYVQDTAVAGKDTLISNGGSDIFISKLDSDGNFLWAKTRGGKFEDIGYGIALHNNSLAVAGLFSDTIVSGVGQLSSKGLSDIFVTAIDTDGTVTWAEAAGGTGNDAAYSAVFSQNGEIYITGKSGESSLFQTVQSNLPVFAAKFSSSGNLLWVKDAGKNSGDEGRDIAAGINGEVFITGVFVSDSAGFGATLLSAQGQDVFTTMIQENITTDGRGASITSHHGFTMHPNPVREAITVMINEVPLTNLVVRITNTAGNTVMEKNFFGKKIISIPVDRLPCGIYFISINNIFHEKISIIK